MARLGTGVFGTVEDQVTLLVTVDGSGLATPHWLTGSSTDAGFGDKGRTLWTRPGVTQDVTGVLAVHAAPLLPTHISTAVWDLATLELRVGHFATEALVGVWGLEDNILTSWTPPPIICFVCL